MAATRATVAGKSDILECMGATRSAMAAVVEEKIRLFAGIQK
jgi:hypothetical protein